MTLTATPEGIWTVGQYGLLTLMVSGANPVHAISVDFPNDAAPAWYYAVDEARGGLQIWVGPLKKAGRFQVMVNARDERGCEIANAPGQYVSVSR